MSAYLTRPTSRRVRRQRTATGSGTAQGPCPTSGLGANIAAHTGASAPGTPSDAYARYVGRVGALAVALGVGAAVATGYGTGVARADDTPTTNDSPSAEAPADPAPPGSPSDVQQDKPTPPTGSEDADPDTAANHTPGTDMDVDVSGGLNNSDNDEGQSTDTDTDTDTDNDDNDDNGDEVDDVDEATAATPTPAPPAVEPADGLPPAAVNPPAPPENQGPQGNSATTPPPGARLAGTAAPAGNLDTGDDLGATGLTANAVVAMPSRFGFAPAGGEDLQLLSAGAGQSALTTMADTSLVQTQNAAVGLPGTLINLVTAVVGVFLSPFLAPGPTAPAQPPLLWAVLEFVRREIQRTFFNRTPEAVTDTALTDEDTPTTIAVLGNDVDDDALAVTAVTTPTNGGSVVLNPDGTITYTPKASAQTLDVGEHVTDTFTYTVSDAASPFHLHGLFGLFGRGHADTATVSVTVTGVNDAPVADADAYTVAEEATLTVPAATGLLNGDTDVDAEPLTAVLATGPTNGTLALAANGSFSYTPNANFAGTDTFTYRASDGTTTSAPATVTITVTNINDNPDAVADTPTIAEDSGATVLDVLANDTDVDAGQALTITGITQPSNGQVVNNGTNLSYTPTVDFHGTDTFTYTISDGAGGTDTATVTVTVTVDVPEVIRTLTVDRNPFGVAVSGDRIYVTHLGGTVSVINAADFSLVDTDPADGQNDIDPLTVGDDPTSVVVSGGRIYVTNQGDNTVSVINAENFSPIATVTVGDAPFDLAVSGGRIYVTNQNGDTVSVINAADFSPIATLTVGDEPKNVVVSGGRIYVTNLGDDTVSVFNAANFSPIDTDPADGQNDIDPLAVDGDPSGLAVSGGRIYVTNSNDDAVSVFDAANFSPIDTDPADGQNDIDPLAVGDGPNGVVVSGGRIYVTNAGGPVSVGTVSVFDAANFSPIDTDPADGQNDIDPLTVGDSPRGMAVSPDGHRIYVTNQSDGTVSVIDTGT